ncbi:uncharacterized protein RAG0_00862 [Rhynchosporium agropyri]|uniref:Uncharacterized protein n=1 Tax=Rhynchosporium agropyri TaxID=914238 RepID=A0A1E1JYY0_9HELO|nr:uncharacterized protein RAG0_00862 [Rhynchosporium agropyri]
MPRQALALALAPALALPNNSMGESDQLTLIAGQDFTSNHNLSQKYSNNGKCNFMLMKRSMNNIDELVLATQSDRCSNMFESAFKLTGKAGGRADLKLVPLVWL